MAKKITKKIAAKVTATMTSEEYVKDGGCACPVCKSENIMGESLEADGANVWNTITCEDCGATWLDIYTLTSYDYLKGG
ncbi:MAG: hypothetical protein P9M03_08005 [Candidatus Theseobacter exili]|nr:hypothetical protein [Candidatus Theseobacter exili]